MSMRLVLLVTLTCGLAARTAVADPRLGGDGHSLMYLAEHSPLVLRFFVTIDGKNYATAWNDYVATLFDRLDRDTDGHLGMEEALGIPTSEQLQQVNMEAPIGASRAAVTADTRPPAKKITRDELVTYLNRYGRPFLVDISPRPEPSAGTRTNVDARFFQQLDQDGDGNLRVDEMTLNDSMRKLDLDDDGSISRAELQPLANVSGEFQLLRMENSQPARRSPFVYVNRRASSPRVVAKQLLQQYDATGARGNRDGQLRRDELGISDHAFARADADSNGQLDFDEIRRYANAPAPQFDIIVCLGQRPKDTPIVEVLPVDETNVLVRHEEHSATLRLDQVQIRLNGQPTGIDRDTLLQNYRQRFVTLDSNKDSYLEVKEVQDDASLGNAFPFIDVDADEKIFEKEFLDYFVRLAEAANSRTTLSVVERGSQLFDILDANRDNRLTSREIHAGSNHFTEWDVNADQRIELAEVPRQWQLTVARGAPSSGLSGADVPETAARDSPSDAPKWFERMDRNRDGEVTMQEFLGSAADFQKLDTDTNGAIVAAEAAAIP